MLFDSLISEALALDESNQHDFDTTNQSEIGYSLDDDDDGMNMGDRDKTRLVKK
jgi:hypothetical protein